MRSAAGPDNRITQTAHLSSRAVDYSARPDRNIYAPEDMVITENRVAGACGNLLRAKGATGVHTFCHLERETVKVDQRVKKGQVIGIMGYSGTTIPPGLLGRHLHWYIETPQGYVYPPKLINEEADMKPTRSEVGDAHNYLGISDEDVPEKTYQYYMARRERKLYQNVLAALYKKWLAMRKSKNEANTKLRAIIDELNSKEKVYKADLQAAINKVSKLTSDLEQTEQELDAVKEELDQKPVDNSNALQRLIDGAAELVQVIINKLTGGTKQ